MIFSEQLNLILEEPTGRNPLDAATEIIQKLENWSHSQEFNVPKYMALWERVTLDNYLTIKNQRLYQKSVVW